MKNVFALAALSAAVANGAATPAQKRATSLPTVTVEGNAFYAGSSRFFIRGVDYQPGGSSEAKDPIADVSGCKRDIVEFKKLGINTIRVYTVDNTANHDECMNALADAGIYLALDVNTPLYSINRADPAPSYNPTYLQSIFATIDAFQGYTNTLLFFSGNEVINDANTTTCAPYVKAVTRDMRQYIKSRGYRSIPVGYSAADVDENRVQMAEYMNCGTDDQRSDFYAFNDYAWCDPSSFTTSGWDQKVKKFANYSLPLFLSEYGCNINKRTFGAVKSLYDSDMAAVYSGGLVYEYSQEESKYGLGQINGDSYDEFDDFTALQSALAANPAPTDAAGARTDTGSASDCPATSSDWNISPWTGELLPALPSGAAQYMTNGAGTGPGLTGKGSQNAGGESTATASPGSASVTGAAASSTSSKSAASSLIAGDLGMGPFVCMGVVLVSTLFGAALI